MTFNALCTVTVLSPRRNPSTELPKVFHIDSRTLQYYLPLLPLTPHINASHLVSPESRDPHMRKAFLFLFTHIAEVSQTQTHTSSALLQNLEATHKKHSQRTTTHRPARLLTHHHALGRNPPAKDPTAPIFDRLAYLLRRYGHHPDLATNMATFFTRHCDALVRRDPAAALMCLRGLSALGARMDPVLACVASCPRRNAERVLRLAAAVGAQLRTSVLPGEVLERLWELVEQRGRGLVRAGGGGEGGGRRARTLLRGDEMAFEDLEAFWLGAGHRIMVDVTGREGMLGGRGYDEDGYDDDDDGYGYDEFDEFEDGEGYYSAGSEDSLDEWLPRRGGPAYAQPRLGGRLEGRRQRDLEWRGREVGRGVGLGGYGGYGEEVGVGGMRCRSCEGW